MPKMVQTDYGEWYVPYRPSALKNIMGQSWFPYLAFFIGLAAVAVGAAVIEKIYKRQQLIENREHLLQVLPVLGDRSAPVKVMAFTDYACTFCSEDHFRLQEILKPYIEQGKVALFTVNIQKLGFSGQIGALFESCIGRHDPAHLQSFVDSVFRNNQEILEAAQYLQAYQKAGGTALKEVEGCINTPEATRYQQMVRSYIERLGVMGISVRSGAVAVQDHVTEDTRGLELWVQQTVQGGGALPAAFLDQAQRLH